MGWLIYGNILYFSPENNCKDIEATKPFNSLMLFLLILGYFQFLAFGLLICILPILIFFIHRHLAANSAQELDD